jgi:hypothetical protein
VAQEREPRTPMPYMPSASLVILAALSIMSCMFSGGVIPSWSKIRWL